MTKERLTESVLKRESKMKRKTKAIIFALVLVLFSVVISIYPIYTPAKDYVHSNAKFGGVEIVRKSDIISCNFNLLEPEYMVIYAADTPDNIFLGYEYYSLKRANILSQEWHLSDKQNIYGRGNISGFIFEEFKKIAKLDCDMFKENNSTRKEVFQEIGIKWEYEQLEEIKQDITYTKEQRKQDQIESGYGYEYTPELTGWVVENFTSGEAFLQLEKEMTEVGINLSNPNQHPEIVKYLHENYNLPEKPGYPVE